MNSLPAIAVGRGGWVRLTLPELLSPVYVRFKPSPSGRLDVHDVCFTPEAALPLDALRSVPLDRLSVWANSPEALPAIMEAIADPAPEVSTLLAFWNYDVHDNPEDDHWVARSFRAQLEDSDQPAAIPPERESGPRRQRRGTASRSRLRVPSSRPYPDDFYRQVAAIYTALALRSSTPARDIAETYKVKATTVHGWIASARKRGFLTASPGQGRVG